MAEGRNLIRPDSLAKLHDALLVQSGEPPQEGTIMLNRLGLIAVTAVVIGLAFAPRANAGVEMVEPEYAPAPRYSYVPPPPPPQVIYYAPPPPLVIVERGFAFHRPYYRGHGRHFYGRRGHWHRGGHHRR